jgi:threonine/homoserine/homoserine lactone efflux protein
LLKITPGLDTVMVLRTAARGRVAQGNAGRDRDRTGALIAALPMLFAIVRRAGAAYLAWMGIGLLLRPRSALDISGADAAPGFRLNLVARSTHRFRRCAQHGQDHGRVIRRTCGQAGYRALAL